MHLEVQAAQPGRAAECPEILGSMKRAPNLGGDLKLGPGLRTQKAAEPMLGKSATIPRGGVEVAHAQFPGRLERCARIALGDIVVELGEMRRSEPESRKFERGGAHLPARRNRYCGQSVLPIAAGGVFAALAPNLSDKNMFDKFFFCVQFCNQDLRPRIDGVNAREGAQPMDNEGLSL